MYEFGVVNKITGEERAIYGYDLADAFRRCKKDPAEWQVSYREYID